MAGSLASSSNRSLALMRAKWRPLGLMRNTDVARAPVLDVMVPSTCDCAPVLSTFMTVSLLALARSLLKCTPSPLPTLKPPFQLMSAVARPLLESAAVMDTLV